jgi:hypothetical protein
LAARQHYSVIAGVLALLLVAACSYASIMARDLSVERINEISYRLKLVSEKADSELRYTDAEKISEEAIFSLIQKDRSIYDPFKDLYLAFSIQGNHVVALVCDNARHNMIAEDSHCTDEVDKTMATHGKLPCSFTLNLMQLCVHK